MKHLNEKLSGISLNIKEFLEICDQFNTRIIILIYFLKKRREEENDYEIKHCRSSIKV